MIKGKISGIAINSSEVVAAGTYSVTMGNHGFETDATIIRYIGIGRD